MKIHLPLSLRVALLSALTVFPYSFAEEQVPYTASDDAAEAFLLSDSGVSLLSGGSLVITQRLSGSSTYNGYDTLVFTGCNEVVSNKEFPTVGNQVSFDHISTVIFEGNMSYTSTTPLVPGGVSSQTDGGCISHDIISGSNLGSPSTGARSLSRFTFSDVGQLSFTENIGGLFRCTDLLVKDTDSVLFKDNKAMLVYGYNSYPEVKFENVKEISFIGNGTSAAPLFVSCTELSFTDCGSITFRNNEVGRALISVESNLTNIKKLEITDNTTSGALFGYPIASYGVADSVIIRGNYGNSSQCGGIINSTSDGTRNALTLHGGQYHAATETYTGRGSLVSISDNQAIGGYRGLVGRNSELSVSCFDSLLIRNNTVDATSKSEYTVVLIANSFNVEDVGTIEVKNNKGLSKGLCSTLFDETNVVGFHSFTVEGNSLSSGSRMSGALLGTMVIDGGSTGNAVVNISKNTISVASGPLYGVSTVQSVRNLSTFRYSDNTVTGSGSMEGCLGVPVFENVDTAVFRGNVVRNTGSVSSTASRVKGTLFSLADDVTISGVAHLEFSENKAEGTRNSTDNPFGLAYYAWGGVAYAGSDRLTFDAAASLDILNNTARGAQEAFGGAFYCDAATFNGIGKLAVKGNIAEALSTGSASGGAICAASSREAKTALIITDGGTLVFSGNSAQAILGDSSEASGTAKGGAIYAGSLLISGNESVTVTGNYVAGAKTYGGGIYTFGHTLTISEKNFTSRANYMTDGTVCRLNGIYVDSRYGTPLSLNAVGNAGLVAVYDGIVSKNQMDINAEEGANGTVLFSGRYAQADLAELNPLYTEEALRFSQTVSTGSARIYRGTLALQDGALLELTYTGSNVLRLDASATLAMSNASIEMNGRGQIDGTMTFTGHNELNALAINLSDKAKLNFTIGRASDPVLMQVSSALNQNGTLQLEIVGRKDQESGAYTLASAGSFSTTRWTAGNVSVAATNIDVAFSDLSWVNNTLVLNYREPETDTLRWNNWAGDGQWSASSANWEAKDHQYRKTAGKQVIFSGNDATGEVRLVGNQTAKSVLADIGAGRSLAFVGSGSLAGTSSLTKQGTGTLTLNTANTYTGGTIINGGTLVAGHARALGYGSVRLNSGVLDARSSLQTVSLTLNGGTLLTTPGAISLTGALTLSGRTNINLGNLSLGDYAVLDAASVSGNTGLLSLVGDYEYYSWSFENGSLMLHIADQEQPPVIRDLIIGSDRHDDITHSTLLEGDARVEMSGTGTLTLNTANTYTGGTIINNGMLVAGHARALGYGPVRLNGGILDSGSSLRAVSLVLNGGTLLTTPGAISLTGTLTISGRTDIRLGRLTAGDYTVLDAASVSGNLGLLSLLDVSEPYSWSFDNRSLLLHIGQEEQPPVIDPNVPGAIRENVVISDGSARVINAPIVGTAKVEVNNGSLTLNAASSYTGGTVIDNGSVLVGADNALGSGEVTLRSGSLSIGGHKLSNNVSVKDSAAVGAGSRGGLATMTLSTPGIADTDGTLLFGGVLKLGGSLQVSRLCVSSGNIAGGSIEVSRDMVMEKGTVDANLSGAASFAKVGQGAVTLGGNNSWTGATSVNGGLLVITGRSTVTTLELNGGALSIARGASLTVTDVLSLGGNAYDLDDRLWLSPSVSDSLSDLLQGVGCEVTTESDGSMVLRYTGAAASAQTVAMLLDDEAEVDESVTDGETITDDGAPVDVLVAEDEADVSVGEDREESAAMAILPPSAPAVGTDALAQSSWGVAKAARLFSSVVRDRNAASSVALDSRGTRSAWFSAMSNFSRTRSVGDAAGADADIYGGAMGMQFNGSRGGNAGIALGQTWGRITPMSGRAHVTQKSQHAALYGNKTLLSRSTDYIGLGITASYATTDSDTRQDEHHFDWTQQSVVLGLRAAWEHALTTATAFYAYTGLEYLATNSGSVENGRSGSVRNLKSELGAGLRHTAGKLSLYADTAFSPDVVRHNPVAESYGKRGCVSNPGRLEIRATVGADYRLNGHWNLNAAYSYEGAAHTDNHNVQVGVGYQF